MNFPINKKFEEHFKLIYRDRWEAIRSALANDEKQVLRSNYFASSTETHEVGDKFEFLTNCYWKVNAGGVLKRNHQNLYLHYVMDPSSVFVALALAPVAGESVLDLCAAPGGKTLLLAEQMQQDINGIEINGNDNSSLIANEISEARRQRLFHVLRDYIPEEKRQFIQVRGLDGNQFGLRYASTFDRVLADVPCSGERHLMQNPKEFLLWTPKRSKNLAIRQFSLLSSAWLSLKSGGRVVYSTCSISPEENDGVVERLQKKRGCKILRLDWLKAYAFIEQTKWGYQILPDSCGFGPMYFSVVEKI